MPDQKFCISCGSQLDKDEVYCSNCGMKVGSNESTFLVKTDEKSKVSTSSQSYSEPISPSITQPVSQPLPTQPQPRKSREDPSWKSLEKWVSLGGQFSWVLFVIWIIVRLISIIVLGIVPDTRVKGWFYVFWGFLSITVIIYLGITFLKPFAIKCKEKDWSYLVNDVIVFDIYRIPKMLVLGLVLLIFSSWGSSLVILVSLFIIFMGPEEVQWKTA